MANGMVDEARTRGWLSNLTRPERLAGPEMAALLRAHGRAVAGSPLETGLAAAQLIEESIEALAPADGRSPSALPYRVLRTCFVEGAKNRQAAARLGLSERQLSRERARAIALLAEQLAPSPAGHGGSPPPAPVPFLVRPFLDDAFSQAMSASRRVCVSGPAGCGKTSLVASYASASRSEVFWYRAATPGVPRLPAVLFDLGEHLAPDDPALASYVREALPGLDLGLATRIALSALEGKPRLLVFDGVGGTIDPAVGAFLDAVVAALPGAGVVVTTRAARRRRSLRVPPLTARETGGLLALHGVSSDDRLVAALHACTGGNTSLVASCASWLSGGPVRAPLDDVLRRPALLLPTLRGLARSAGRAA